MTVFVPSQAPILFIGLESTSSVNDALQIVFQGAPRIALASMVAYIIAQTINVRLYSYLYQATNKRMLWLRDNTSNVVGQLVDSLLFFSIAFIGTISNELLLQSILVGFAIKVFVGLLGTPLLYFVSIFKILKKEES